MKPSEMWEKFRTTGRTEHNNYTSWHFCSDKESADNLAELTKNGIKRATASLLKVYEIENEKTPSIGEYSVITDWEGEAVCIIRTDYLEIIPFEKVTKEFAFREGEGDKSLEYWKDVHSHYFSMEMKEYGLEFDRQMDVICEGFEVVFA